MENAIDFKGKYGVTDGARTRDNQNHNLVRTPNKNRSLAYFCRIFRGFSAVKYQQLGKTSRAIFSKFLSLFASLILLLGSASLARAEDISLHWKFSQPVKINTNSSATHLVLSVDPEKLDQPYFPVYGGLTAEVDGVMVMNEPVSGSCRGDSLYFLCQIQNGTMALRIYRRSSSYVMVFVERSPVGEQGPFSLLAE
jgi:hypothetical protein